MISKIRKLFNISDEDLLNLQLGLLPTGWNDEKLDELLKELKLEKKKKRNRDKKKRKNSR